MKGKAYIGTSGFHYKHWKGTFYPENLKPAGYMDYYSGVFKTVELNNPFYKLPEAATFQKWREESPRDFLFAVKANRFITHMKRLKDGAEPFERFINNTKHLKEKLGPILFQLPPQMKVNTERLKDFVKILYPEFRYTFEFRNDTWYRQEVYDILKEHNIAFCIYEIDYHLSPVITTADFVYVRLHGPEAKYQGSYTAEQMDEWAERIKKWTADKKDVYFYFDNDQNGYAPHNAINLIEYCRKRMNNRKVVAI